MEVSRTGFLTSLGVIGSFIANALGGWDTAIYTLFVFMIVDYVSGMIVAGVFQKSGKTENGALKSSVGFKGLLRKGTILFIVLIAYTLDIIFETTIIRNSVIIAYIINETISIIENVGLMGIPLPNTIKKGIEVLRKNYDQNNK